jgi:hypothetical protein
MLTGLFQSPAKLVAVTVAKHMIHDGRQQAVVLN